MTETVDDQRRRIKEVRLGRTIARVAVVFSEEHPVVRRRSLTLTPQVLRPWSSHVDPSTWSLPGGSVNDTDLPTDHNYTNKADFHSVTARTAVRELQAQLGIQVAPEKLWYVDLFRNHLWTTALFYCLVEERPVVMVDTKKIDGFRFKSIHDEAQREEDTFADQGLMYQAIITSLNRRFEKVLSEVL